MLVVEKLARVTKTSFALFSCSNSFFFYRESKRTSIKCSLNGMVLDKVCTTVLAHPVFSRFLNSTRLGTRLYTLEVVFASFALFGGA